MGHLFVLWIYLSCLSAIFCRVEHLRSQIRLVLHFITIGWWNPYESRFIVCRQFHFFLLHRLILSDHLDLLFSLSCKRLLVFFLIHHSRSFYGNVSRRTLLAPLLVFSLFNDISRLWKRHRLLTGSRHVVFTLTCSAAAGGLTHLLISKLY